MLNFRSLANYNSLKKFFMPEWAKIRDILVSNSFTHQEMQLIYDELKNEFSSDFFACLKIGRNMFLPKRLIYVLEELYAQLAQKYEQERCIITSARELNIEQKESIEKILSEKFKNRICSKIEFTYQQKQEICGGLIIKFQGKCYNGSFKNMLINIQSSMQEDIL